MGTLARRLLGSTLVGTTIAAVACGGKVADDEQVATRQNGTTRPSEPLYPYDPGYPSDPPVPPPSVPSKPPPPPADAGTPLEDQLLLGGPRCPKRLPVDGAGCAPQHGSKCEYGVKSDDGGVCRWVCSCTAPGDSDQSTWSCSFGECR